MPGSPDSNLYSKYRSGHSSKGGSGPGSGWCKPSVSHTDWICGRSKVQKKNKDFCSLNMWMVFAEVAVSSVAALSRVSAAVSASSSWVSELFSFLLSGPHIQYSCSVYSQRCNIHTSHNSHNSHTAPNCADNRSVNQIDKNQTGGLWPRQTRNLTPGTLKI